MAFFAGNDLSKVNFRSASTISHLSRLMGSVRARRARLAVEETSKHALAQLPQAVWQQVASEPLYFLGLRR